MTEDNSYFHEMDGSPAVAVREYQSTDFQIWKNFVLSSNNGTMFHRTEFLDYHPQGRFNFHHLMFFSGKNLIAVLPGSLENGEYRSPAGASMGSFAVSCDLKLHQAHAIVSSFIAYCRSKGVRKIYLTPPMEVYNTCMNQAMEYALSYNGFTISRAQYSSVKRNSQCKLSAKIRYNIGMALRKGIKVVEDDDVRRFYPILLANKEKFGTAPTHTLEELMLLQKLMPEAVKLFLAELNGQPVAGVLLFLANSSCALNFYSMHLYEYRKYYPVSVLVHYAGEWLNRHNIHYLDYGVSMDTFSSNLLEPSWSLVRFKESLGFAGCIRNTWTVSL